MFILFDGSDESENYEQVVAATRACADRNVLNYTIEAHEKNLKSGPETTSFRLHFFSWLQLKKSPYMSTVNENRNGLSSNNPESKANFLLSSMNSGNLEEYMPVI